MVDGASDHLCKADPILAAIIARIGPCAMVRREPNFETLARSVTFQQLSGKAAIVIFNRLKKAAGRRLTASAFLRLTPQQLRECGLSRQKIATLTDLAEKVVAREIVFRKLPGLEDDEVIALLSRVHGIGVWTAQMFLMFALQRPNVMPAGDLGIRQAVRKAYGLAELPKPTEVTAFAEKWHPHCTSATWYLWKSLNADGAV